MKQHARRLLGAFWASLIIIAGICGFAVIDLSTEYYMPGSFEPMMQISKVDQTGFYFAFMGKHYKIDATPFEAIGRALEPWRLFLPIGPQWASLLTEKAYYEAETVLAQLDEEEQEWQP